MDSLLKVVGRGREILVFCFFFCFFGNNKEEWPESELMVPFFRLKNKDLPIEILPFSPNYFLLALFPYHSQRLN